MVTKRTILIIIGSLLLCAGPGVVLTGTLVTFIMPEAFSSTARIKIDRPGSDGAAGVTNAALAERMILTEVEVVRSEVVLERAIENLDLNVEWGKMYAGGERLFTSEVMGLLKAQIAVRPVPNANIIKIVAYSQGPEEAADLANGVADAYVSYMSEVSDDGEARTRVQLLERATPNLRAVKPNKPLNILISGATGAVLMLIGGVLLAIGVRTRK